MTKKQTKVITIVFAVVAIGSMIIASLIQAVYFLGIL
jgi:hypothetical protein